MERGKSMRNNFVEERKNILKKYKDDILTPLDQFYSSHYKMLVEEQNKEVLDHAYDVYFKKLENFSILVEQYQSNDKKQSK